MFLDVGNNKWGVMPQGIAIFGNKIKTKREVEKKWYIYLHHLWKLGSPGEIVWILCS